MNECPDFYNEFKSVASRAAKQASLKGTVAAKRDEFKKLIVQDAQFREIDLHYFILVVKTTSSAAWSLRYPKGKYFSEIVDGYKYVATIYKCWSVADQQEQETEDTNDEGSPTLGNP